MGILNNNIIKYAFDNNPKGKNEIEEYKKLLLKYKQVLDWYRQDLQDYNYMFLTRDENGNIHFKDEHLPHPAPQVNSITKEDVRDVLEAFPFPQDDGITKEDVRNVLDTFPFPQSDGITKEDVRNVLEAFPFPQSDGITKEDVREALDLHEVLNNIDLVSQKLEKIDNSFSDYVYSDPVLPDYEADFEAINQNFIKLEALLSSNSLNDQVIHSITVTLYKIEEKLNALENTVHTGFEFSNAKLEESINTNTHEDILLKISELNQKVIHMHSDINREMDSKLASNSETIGRKLESLIQENSFTNRKLVTILSISTILNVISVGLLLYFIF